MVMPQFHAIASGEALEVRRYHYIIPQISKIRIAELFCSRHHKEVAARNHHLAREALFHLRATEEEAELHGCQRALAEVNTLFGTISCW
jgi:hypothetical protein